MWTELLRQLAGYEVANVEDMAIALASESDPSGRQLLDQHTVKKTWNGNGLVIELDNGRTFLADDSGEFRRLQLLDNGDKS